MNGFPTFEDLGCGLNSVKKTQRYIHIHYPEFEEYILNNFSFVTTWAEKIYCYFNDIKSTPVCPECSKPVKFRGVSYGYSKFCSHKCANSSASKKKQAVTTCLTRYGVENPFQSCDVKNKIKRTCLDKYGVENPMQSAMIKDKMSNIISSDEVQNNTKQTCLTRYGVEYPSLSNTIKDKIKQTCLSRYGAKCYTQSVEGRNKLSNILSSKEVQNKTKQTNLLKYGVENPIQSQMIKDEIKQSNKDKYGVEYYSQSQEYKNRHDEIQDKVKQTCLDRYGVGRYTQSAEGRDRLSNILGSQEIQYKTKQTNLLKYGVENPVQSQMIKDKIKQSNKDKYGAEYYFQSQEYKNRHDEIRDKVKQTNLLKYGVENPIQSQVIKDKIKQSNKDKYGAEYYFQSQEYKNRHDEIQDKINETKRINSTFNTSKIEDMFDAYLNEHDIRHVRQYKSTLYPFCCDFYLPTYDLYIEIQASWTHGGHPYDAEHDAEKLEYWRSKHTRYYGAAIETWTRRDVKKRETAKLNNLNYLEIFSNDINECIKQFEDYINKTLL